MVLVQSLSRSHRQDLGESCDHLDSGSASRIGPFHGWWPRPQSSSRNLTIWLLKSPQDMAAGFPNSSDSRESARREPQCLLGSKMTSHTLSVQPTLKRRIKLYLLKGGDLKILWTCVKTTRKPWRTLYPNGYAFVWWGRRDEAPQTGWLK